MNNLAINISDLQCGMMLKVKDDCIIKGFELKKDTNLYIKRIYSRGDKVSFIIPSHLLKDSRKKTLVVGAKYINIYFEIIKHGIPYQEQNSFDLLELNKNKCVEIDKGEEEMKTNIKLEPIGQDVKEAFRNGPVTVVILHSGHKGVAKCLNEDKFNQDIGYGIACVKARRKYQISSLKSIKKGMECMLKQYTTLVEKTEKTINKLDKKLVQLNDL